jgi:hypothetical protein
LTDAAEKKTPAPVARGGKAVTDAQARKTAFVVASVFLAIAAWNLYRGRAGVVAAFGGLGVALLLAGLFAPALARRFHVLWMRLAAALGYVNSRVLLTVMFYGVFTPYGLVSRLIKRDPLSRRGVKRDTYWTERTGTRQTRDGFERLF